MRRKDLLTVKAPSQAKSNGITIAGRYLVNTNKCSSFRFPRNVNRYYRSFLYTKFEGLNPVKEM